jgi:Spy/CpxP family protein refolding chaperone
MMTVGALAIVASIAAISIADAQPRRGRVREGLPAPKAEMRQQAAEKLNLSDAQKDKLAAIHEDTQRQQVLRHGKMADLRAQIRVEFMNDNLDKDKIRTLHREMSALKAAVADARLEARLATRDVFTPEQREQLKQMRRDAPRAGMHGRHGRMQGRGGRGMGPGSCAPGMGRGFGAELGTQTDDQAPMMGMGFLDGDFPGFDPMGPGPWWMDDDDAPAPPAPPALPDEE